MRAIGGILAVLLTWAVAADAGAVTMSFEDVVDFQGDGQDRDNRNEPWRTYQAVDDLLVYKHYVAFNPEAASLVAAEVVLSHKGNDHRAKDTGKGPGFNPAELWFLAGDQGILIGELAKSENQWHDQVFRLDADDLAGVGGASWTLVLRLREETPGTDWLWLDRSVLRGTYEAAAPVPEPASLPLLGTAAPVPEPASLLLLGSGLAGLAAIRRRQGRGVT